MFGIKSRADADRPTLQALSFARLNSSPRSSRSAWRIGCKNWGTYPINSMRCLRLVKYETGTLNPSRN